jgi:putative transposase
MKEIDQLHTQYPFYGASRIRVNLPVDFQLVNLKRVSRLMRLMQIEAIYQQPNLSLANATHRVYPYLLRNVLIENINQVWSTDITYVPIKQGFLYVCAVVDWYSRFILSWEISNTLTLDFCKRTLQEAVVNWGKPQIFNTDQGSQFTSNEFTDLLLEKEVLISMDGKGRPLDNIFIAAVELKDFGER